VELSGTNVSDVIKGMQLGGETTMDTEELFVHDSSKGQCTEGRHACVVDSFGVLSFAWNAINIKQQGQRDERTFKFESEVIRQMPALMVSSQQEQCIWIPHFQGPQIQYALIRTISEALATQEKRPTSILKYPRST
jgi:hypothetical protein